MEDQRPDRDPLVAILETPPLRPPSDPGPRRPREEETKQGDGKTNGLTANFIDHLGRILSPVGRGGQLASRPVRRRYSVMETPRGIKQEEDRVGSNPPVSIYCSNPAARTRANTHGEVV